jgi:biopolymer transport protein ExbB
MKAFVTFVTHDWYIFFPMFLMSLSGIGLVLWRLMLNINTATNLGEFLPAFQDRLDRDGVEGALKYCRSRTDTIPKKLFAAGLEVAKQGLSASRRAMANALELDILPDMNFLLPSILAIAKIATMVGLLGTVISMIQTFGKIQSGSSVQEQAGSIGLALFATAMGLITAIPLVYAHVLFKANVSRNEARMKSAAQKLILLLQSARSGGKPSGGGKPSVPPPPSPTGVSTRQ